MDPEDRNNHHHGAGGNDGGQAIPPGFIGYPYMPVMPGRISPTPQEYQPFQYPQMPSEEMKRPLDGGFSPSAMPPPPAGNVGGFVLPQV